MLSKVSVRKMMLMRGLVFMIEKRGSLGKWSPKSKGMEYFDAVLRAYAE